MTNRNYCNLPFLSRFWSYVHKTFGCWLWTGPITGGGYGVLGRDRGYIKAHRASWEINNGPIPANIFVLHKCDNRKCVNPEHLFLGTQKDNVQDCMAKGRRSLRNAAKLSLAQVSSIKERLKNGEVGNRLAKEFGITRTRISQLKK